MSSQSNLDGYTKPELHKIVEIYNLGLSLKELQQTKAELIKSMKKVGKKKLVDMPNKPALKKYKIKRKVPKKDPKQKDIKNFFGSK
tara:strand:- start:1 stop:258 length:258 start_codon:yes stop_codon:yes gene_type:complete